MTTRGCIRRRALVLASILCGGLVIVSGIGGELHARGVGQGVLSYAIRVCSILELPGFIAIDVLGMRENYHTGPVAWWVMQAINLVAYTLGAALLLTIASQYRHRSAAKTSSARAATPGQSIGSSKTTDAPRWLESPERPHELGAARRSSGSGGPAPTSAALPRRGSAGKRLTRRAFLASGSGTVAAGIFGYTVGFEPRRVEITRRTIALPNLPPTLDGLRLVQLTDLHHGPWISIGAVRSFVRRTNDLKPDLILLTGDYVHRSPAYIEPVAEALADLRASIGVVAVLGNHDWWEDGPRTRRALERAGIPLLDNTRRFVTSERALTTDALHRGLCVAGVGDHYEDEQRYADALGGVSPGVPRLLLSHNPDVAEDRDFVRFVRADRDRHRVDLMIAGHTHGGQVDLPGVGQIVPSRYGQKYVAGLCQGPVCPVYVSRGLGLSVLPVRLNVPPEITVMELTRA